ncbi:MAG TPA: hypothetical protein VHB74_05220 [Devosia sp.]|nr:hypothetical protein [Devosia sp.]
MTDDRNRAADRIGVAELLRFAFDGNDLTGVRAALQAQMDDPGAAMDLSIIEQILGNQEAAMALQHGALEKQRLYRSPCAGPTPTIRVLALAAPVDVGGNTPVEFLLNDPAFLLETLYVVPGHPVAAEIPEHDIAIVVMSDGDDCAPSLAQLIPLAEQWPRLLLNLPAKVAQTDRDRLFMHLRDIPGLCIPATVRLSRQDLEALGRGEAEFADGFPVIARPVGSHAGRGLERLEDRQALAAYLAEHAETDFFLMRFVDFSSADGQFRKYRVVFVDGEPFACHMAIADQWRIWYLNAGMAESAAKRAEEAAFFAGFDTQFRARHGAALEAIAERVGLDYFSIDCAETKQDELLVFEAGVAMAVHDMDSPVLYPYKPPQMARVFAAFAAMLKRRVAGAS